MILFISGKISGSSSVLMEIFEDRKIPAFRFNLDMFDSYKFLWDNDSFEITDPVGRTCKAADITAMVFYKGAIPSWFSFDNKIYSAEKDWLVSWLNQLYICIMCYGEERGLIRLWRPHGFGCAKTLQMRVAKKYFTVPKYMLHWGQTLDSHQVIAKTLTQRPLSCGEMAYAKIVDRADLDPAWPWFTQEIADGNRDATVVYINGKVHCYQFATERGE